MKRSTKSIERVGLIANVSKPNCIPLLRRVVALIRKSDKVCIADEATKELADLDIPTVRNALALCEQVDMLVVLGGDGTLLRVVREMHGKPTPLLGINVGRLGFLTGVPANKITEAFDKVWEGRFSIDQRAMIEARNPARSILLRALNDIVISRGAAPRMIELEVRVDDELLTCFRCDGLIVSSPTGSTAYSLSAGGAIVSPAADVLAITPICPHTLSNRSVILSLNSKVEVKVISERQQTTVTADGQVQCDLETGDVVQIGRSRKVVHWVQLEGQTFFNTVRQKLHWSGNNF